MTAEELSEQQVKPQLRVRDVLALKDHVGYTILDTSTINDAITHLTQQHATSTLAVDSQGDVSGIFTAWDIIRFLHEKGGSDSSSKTNAMKSMVSEMMTKKERMIYCSPDDSIKQCREIMFSMRISNLPVFEYGEVFGIITFKDLANSKFSLSESGGKKGFIYNVTGRKGLPAGTKWKQGDSIDPLRKNLPKLGVDIGQFALPHPFKRRDGVAGNLRQHRGHDLATDLAYCEGTN
jgi:CBS domain-containing protein